MLQNLRPAFVLLVLFTALLGLAYPLAITQIAQIVLPAQAGGSLITRNGALVGSELIGQNFASDRYFHGRPSATSMPDPVDATKSIDAPYNAANSGGSNYGPTSQKLADRVKADVTATRTAGATGPVPADSVTTSASGLDPHISIDYARQQIGRVAASRQVEQDRVAALVEASFEKRTFGIFGEPRVNVLRLNLALDAATAVNVSSQ